MKAIGVQISRNFVFLKVHSIELVRLGSLAGQYFANDPNTCLIKLRQFGEVLAQLVAAKVGLYEEPGERQVDLLRRLKFRGAVTGQAADMFHEIRKKGNDATHDGYDDKGVALNCLKYARSLGVWFHRNYGGAKQFKAGPFVPPVDPAEKDAEIRQELERLASELAASEAAKQAAMDRAALAQTQATEEAELRQLAELLLSEAETQAEDAQATIAEISEQFETQLNAMQAAAAETPAQEIQQLVVESQLDEQNLDLDERATRKLIDAKLAAVGWEVDSEKLTYGKGARPQKHKNMAIAEWLTADGRADYILFAGLQVVGAVEAKRQGKNVYGAIDQAKRYSRGYQVKSNEKLVAGHPWQSYQIPFVFATNGGEYLKQLEHKSGIWFCDVRRKENLRRAIGSWYSPEGLLDLLRQDNDKAHELLRQTPFDYGFELRPYQIEAIKAVESALENDQRSLLLAMATGTGKTKTCIAMVYRLLKTKRFRRVLFLVDRTALGEQATGAFEETKMENLQTFAQIFDLKGLKEQTPDRDTKVHVATVQSFVMRLLYSDDEGTAIATDQYDCVVVDECHRGYLLDRELSDNELTFRDFGDYVSKYRQVLDYFDAVKIGLTATPALHTSEIFGRPVYTYSYREAVIDGYLIDHEPAHRIRTALSEDGMVWKPGEKVKYIDPKTGQIDLAQAPDEIRVEVEQFNRRVITESFNRVVCEALAHQIDPTLREMGKTLIFCVNEDHAVLVTKLLKKVLQEQYEEVGDDDVVKITGASDKPLELIRRYKNEVSPRVAVTVDLMTTGIDVPEICNLVFLRRVKSRILYEQMLGRATRMCDDIDKQIFRIFDAVDLYSAIQDFSTMKPVVVNPDISFGQLVDELSQVTKPDAVTEILEQIQAKLQRKKRHLSEAQKESIESLAGIPVDELASHLKQLSPEATATWLRSRKQIAEILDRKDGGRRPKIVSDHADELRSVSQDFRAGDAGALYTMPGDYLENFRDFINNSQNEIPALLVVTQRPRDLTREQLKALRVQLDAAGYSETRLRSAWRNQTNEDIAASIIGFIRQAAVGEALVPYGDRVQKAIKKIAASQPWTAPQRKWLERIGKQLEKEYVVDRDALERGAFKTDGGGFERLNKKIFKGRLEQVLTDINQALWDEVS
ncbi:MAG: type I restriction-modification system endonuclease [Cyanobacteria bacterium J06581_3]